MASGDFGQMDVGHGGVRFEADLFEIGDPLGGKGVIEIFGDRVGIQARSALGDAGGG